MQQMLATVYKHAAYRTNKTAENSRNKLI